MYIFIFGTIDEIVVEKKTFQRYYRQTKATSCKSYIKIELSQIVPVVVIRYMLDFTIIIIF